MRLKARSLMHLLSVCVCLLLLNAVTVDADPDDASETVRFAVVGDYGQPGQGTANVAALINRWDPDYVVTTGDNNYVSPDAIDDAIGQYYYEYIAPYQGIYGEGAETNRFFPALGNHDWLYGGIDAYLDYFTLPGNERYYDVDLGSVHLFILDSTYSEPDGIAANSIQAVWLRDALAASTASWQVIVAHLPPFSSGYHGDNPIMNWPFQVWGADAVLAGHDHGYERIIRDEFPYFVNGTGGGALYAFGEPVEGSKQRYNADHGAMLVTATDEAITFEYYSIWEGGTRVDSYTLSEPS